jgi:hypothetical protein
MKGKPTSVRSEVIRTNAGEQGVDSLRIGREGGLGLAVATGRSAGLLHKSPRACRRLLLIITFNLQIATKRKWTRGDSNPWPPPCEGGALPTELRAREASAILAAASWIARQEAKVIVTLSSAVRLGEEWGSRWRYTAPRDLVSTSMRRTRYCYRRSGTSVLAPE